MKKITFNNIKDSKMLGSEISTYICDGRRCWKGTVVASVLGYNTPARAVNRFLKARNLEKEIDYDILEGEKLKVFKKEAILRNGDGIIKASKLIIFYEKAVYEFMLYSEKECAKKFQEWFTINLNKDFQDKENYENGLEGENSNNQIIGIQKIEREKKVLFDTVQLVQNLYLLNDDSTIMNETIEGLMNISKYIVAKIGES